jgi:hypothetical protein
MAQSNVRSELSKGRAVSGAETAEQRKYRAETSPGGLLWPELRIGRRADYTSMSQSVDDWNFYLNHSAALNRRRGLARPLGTLEMHYVTDRELRDMVLAETYGIDRDRRAAIKRYDEIRRHLKDFLCQQDIVGNSQDWAELCERPDLMGKTHGIDPSRIKRSPRASRSAELVTRSIEQSGIIGYDGNVFGLNLSQNRRLYEERNEVLRFLRREEGLETSRYVRKDWEPHATIFEVNPHLRAADLNMVWPQDIPHTIDFGPVIDLSQV